MRVVVKLYITSRPKAEATCVVVGTVLDTITTEM
jgi:hypothetical protein